MNPMSDKLYRDWRANELDREITRETRIRLALQAQPADPANLATHPVRFSMQLWLVTMSAKARGTIRHLSASASRPAGS